MKKLLIFPNIQFGGSIMGKKKEKKQRKICKFSLFYSAYLLPALTCMEAKVALSSDHEGSAFEDILVGSSSLSSSINASWDQLDGVHPFTHFLWRSSPKSERLKALKPLVQILKEFVREEDLLNKEYEFFIDDLCANGKHEQGKKNKNEKWGDYLNVINRLAPEWSWDKILCSLASNPEEPFPASFCKKCLDLSFDNFLETCPSSGLSGNQIKKYTLKKDESFFL